MRIQLRIYLDPGELEVFLNVKRRDDIFRTLIASVDTGAVVSLLPNTLLPELDYRVSDQGTIVIQRAGIIGQDFEAIEAYVTVFLEDQSGARAPDSEVRVRFADTNTVLIGFADMLDRVILHVDMLQLQGWLDIEI